MQIFVGLRCATDGAIGDIIGFEAFMGDFDVQSLTDSYLWEKIVLRY